jgi:malate/lactate dehydrogenase
MPSFKKIAIVGGAGGVGSTLAFYLGLKDIAAQIALIDVRANVLETLLIDLRECFSEECATEIVAGGPELLAGADLAIMAAAQAGGPVNSRGDYLERNLEIVVKTAKAVKAHCPQALCVVATAPTDVFTMVFHDILAGDRHRLLGFCRNDSLRFRLALAKALKIDPKRVSGTVLGEHGHSQVPVFSNVTVDGERVLLNTERKAQVQADLTGWYAHWQAQNSGRTTSFTSAISLYKTLLALRGETKEIPIGSVILDGEYGLKDVALGVPLAPGPAGWGEAKELPLSLEEIRALRRSGKTVRALYEEARALYPR